MHAAKLAPTALLADSARRLIEWTGQRISEKSLSVQGANNRFSTAKRRRNLRPDRDLLPNEFSPADRQLQRVKTPPRKPESLALVQQSPQLQPALEGSRPVARTRNTCRQADAMLSLLIDVQLAGDFVLEHG